MNIPFELIFIVLFFVLPALSSVVRRVQGRGQPRPPTRNRPDRPGAPNPSADTRTQTETRTDVPRWLEEAQRRVREAQQGETEGRGGRGTQATSQPQTARPLVQPRPSTPRPSQTRPAAAQPKPTSYEDYRPTPVSLERTSAPTKRPTKTPAPPLRVQRVGVRRGTRPGSYKMRFDEETLMTGFIWHQILSEPLSKRRNGQSQRQR